MGVELRIVSAKSGRVPMEDFAASVDKRTRLLTVAWVSNRNGYRYDLPSLAELAHDNGAYLYVDAVQAFGTFPVNLHDEGADFACGNGYKWLFADFGCAPLYVKKDHLEWLEPDRYGHGSVAENLPDLHFRLKETPRSSSTPRQRTRRSRRWTRRSGTCKTSGSRASKNTPLPWPKSSEKAPRSSASKCSRRRTTPRRS